MTLIDAFVVGGIAVVVPLAQRVRPGPWVAAGLVAVLSFALAPGAAAGTLAFVPVLLALRLLLLQPGIGSLYVMIAMASFVVSRLGLTPLGQEEPIVELTAVHYVYAGAGALALANATRRIAPVVLTAIAPPVIAFGFVSGWALPQVGGAVVLALGVWATAALQLSAAWRCQDWPVTVRALLAVSGLAVIAPMVLAVAWAAGQHWAIPILSIPDMARTHGAANAIGFVLCGLAARRIDGRVPVTV